MLAVIDAAGVHLVDHHDHLGHAEALCKHQVLNGAWFVVCRVCRVACRVRLITTAQSVCTEPPPNHSVYKESRGSCA